MSRVLPDESSDSVYLTDMLGHLGKRSDLDRSLDDADSDSLESEIDDAAGVSSAGVSSSEAIDDGVSQSSAIEDGLGGASVGPNFDLVPRVPTSFAYAFFKRSVDIVGALVGLMIFSPFILLCSILVKISDGGPILYSQERVGQGGRRFRLFKFRSMVINAEAMKEDLIELNSHGDNRTFKILNDPRITPVGHFMRRLSLDEVPQFWNILKGDMSLVGPRPALPSEVELYERRHLLRLAVVPGLTCIWQVSGRSNLEFERQMDLDAQYIRTRGIWTDVSLILRTFPAVLRGEGAA